MTAKIALRPGRELETISEAMGDWFASLRWRWIDEQEYEDFSEYRKVTRERLKRELGAKLVGMSRSPFAARFDIGPQRFEIRAQPTRIVVQQIAGGLER